MKIDIPEIYADAKTCNIIRCYLQSNKISDLCNINEASSNDIILLYQNQKNIYSTPVKLGEVLDKLIYYKTTNEDNNSLISFEGGDLDIHQGIFINQKGDQIYLTEKEVEILSFLHASKSKVTSRDELLSAVWNYAKDVETHTLETHIYRLRQKIEVDPANPIILLTKEDGYSVSKPEV